jgi:simple sugar transport system ATP-binding protein
MIGHDIPVTRRTVRPKSADVVLALKQVTALSDRGFPAVQDVTFDVAAGQMVGLAGVAGNGQRELAEVVTGLRPVREGSVRILGADTTGRGARAVAAAGVGHIPEDRLGHGLVGSLPVTDNAILREYDKYPLSTGPRLHGGAARRFARALVDDARVVVADLASPVARLSGGNQQRLVIGRETRVGTRMLVAVHPTRGLDVAATESVRQRLRDYCDGGGSVLLISEDLDEILAMCDRVLVMSQGKLVGDVDPADADLERIGLLMGGASVVSRAMT